MAMKKKATKKPGARSARSAPKKSTRKIIRKAKPALLPVNEYMRIGEHSDYYGGQYMGTGRGTDGQPDYYLYRGPQSPKPLNHADALKFAKACETHNHKDWDLPDRTDGALLYANGRDQAKSGLHWLKPQYAHYGAYAWAQHFGDGDQINGHKSYELEVVLVRRVPIQ